MPAAFLASEMSPGAAAARQRPGCLTRSLRDNCCFRQKGTPGVERRKLFGVPGGAFALVAFLLLFHRELGFVGRGFLFLVLFSHEHTPWFLIRA